MSLKKTLPETIRKVKAAHPTKRVIVACMDESRFGLLPIFRRKWSFRGSRPTQQIRLKYQWVYLFSVVEPTTGQIFSMIWNTVNIPVMQCFLNEYSKTLPKDAVCVLVLDGAGWHSEKGLDYPDNIIPLKQPAYSPECNPTESLWGWVRDKLGGHLYNTLDELQDRLSEIVNQFDRFRNELKSRLNYSWWAKAHICN